jgi:hypothetical protein
VDEDRDDGAGEAPVGCTGCGRGGERAYGDAGHMRNSIVNAARYLLTNSLRHHQRR